MGKNNGVRYEKRGIKGTSTKKMFIINKKGIDVLRAKATDWDDYYIWCAHHVIYEAGKPLTQEEIREGIFHLCKKRLWLWTKRKCIRRAVKHGVFSVQNQGDRITYYPNMTYEEFLLQEEKKMKEILNSPNLSHYTTFHASPKVMTVEEYEKIKKLIDELE